MRKVLFGFIAILTIFAMISCDDGGGSGGGKTTEKSKAAALTSLKFGDDTINVGTAITAAAWGTTTTLDNLTNAQAPTYQLAAASKDITITAAVSAKAKAEFVATENTTKPTTFAAATNVTIKAGGYVIIKVTAEDGTTINYYAVNIELTGGNTTLSGLTVASSVEATSITGSKATTLAGLNAFAPINLPDADKTNATVSLNLPTAFKGVAKIAKIAKAATISEDDFTTTYDSTTKPQFTFADEDKIYVQMTAENGISMAYYAYQVLIGWDATLATEKGVYFKVTIGTGAAASDKDVDDVDLTLGTPAADAVTSLLDVVAEDSPLLGKAMFNTGGSAFKVFATPTDSGATVKYSLDGTTWKTPGATGVNAETFNATTAKYLYFEVVSSNGKGKNYYKFEVVLQKSITLPYGTLATVSLDTIDPKWETDATEWLWIDRTNVNETQAILEMDPKDRSFGRAKLMWDLDGIYVYAQVWETTISDKDAPTTGGGSDMHTVSSVELFVNENPNVTTGSVTGGQNGGQYRLGANGAVSGANDARANAMRTLGKTVAKKYDVMPFTQTEHETEVVKGYAVMFQAPWWNPTTYPPVDGKKLSIELQINATGPAGTRVGVLNWNNKNSNSYNSLANYGQAVLDATGVVFPAVTPTISAQPASKKIAMNTAAGDIPALTVTASKTDEGVLSYAWYEATGTTAAPATDTKKQDSAVASYTPTIDTSVAKDFYFYVVVTNTLGESSKSLTSSVANYKVVDPATTPMDIEFISSSSTGWNAESGGVVFEKTGGWDGASNGPLPVTGAEFDIPKTFNLQNTGNTNNYSRIEFKFIGYYDDGSPVTNAGNQYSQDFVLFIYKGTETTPVVNWNNNASSAALSGSLLTSTWNLPGTNGSTNVANTALNFKDNTDTFKISVQAKNGTHTGAAAAPNDKKVSKIVITSLKLIAN